MQINDNLSGVNSSGGAFLDHDLILDVGTAVVMAGVLDGRWALPICSHTTSQRGMC